MLIWSVVSFLYTKGMFISIIRLPLWKQKKFFVNCLLHIFSSGWRLFLKNCPEGHLALVPAKKDENGKQSPWKRDVKFFNK